MPCPASSETIQTNNGSKQRFANKQTNNQAMADESTTRKITLHEFKPESYKVWEMSTKATLKYNKLLNIVDGTETNPTPRNDDGRVLRPFSATTRAQVEKWEHDHERAREAIIRCLPDSEPVLANERTQIRSDPIPGRSVDTLGGYRVGNTVTRSESDSVRSN